MILCFQVRSVLIKSCEDLMVGLDLTGVNPMDIPIKFKNCGKISFSYINFDKQFAGGQLLELIMERVSTVKLEGLDVKDALQVRWKILYLLKNIKYFAEKYFAYFVTCDTALRHTRHSGSSCHIMMSCKHCHKQFINMSTTNNKQRGTPSYN